MIGILALTTMDRWAPTSTPQVLPVERPGRPDNASFGGVTSTTMVADLAESTMIGVMGGVIGFVRRVNREHGATLLIVTHDLDVAAKSDRLVRL